MFYFLPLSEKLIKYGADITLQDGHSKQPTKIQISEKMVDMRKYYTMLVVPLDRSHPFKSLNARSLQV